MKKLKEVKQQRYALLSLLGIGVGIFVLVLARLTT